MLAIAPLPIVYLLSLWLRIRRLVRGKFALLPDEKREVRWLGTRALSSQVERRSMREFRGLLGGGKGVSHSGMLLRSVTHVESRSSDLLDVQSLHSVVVTIARLLL